MKNRTFVLLALGLASLVGLLAWRYPYVIQQNETGMRILYAAILFLLIAPGLIGRYRRAPWLWMKQLLGWAAILLVILAGYAYRHEIMQSRLVAGLVPNKPLILTDGTVEIQASHGGHFFVEAMIGDTPVNFMVDTGASDIVLSPADARRVGFAPEQLSFTRVYATANGYGKGAPVVLNSLRVGNIMMAGVPATVNDAAMDSSLLGMAFFQKLRGFSVEGDRMILKP